MNREPRDQVELERQRLLPLGDLVEIETTAQWPLTFTTAIKNAWGVHCVGAFKSGDEGATVAFGGLQWAYGDAAGELKILALDGLSAGTKYTVRLHVIGKGGQ